MIKVTNTSIPKAEDDNILVVEPFKAIPTPRGRLAQGVYYSFSGKWKNLFDLIRPYVQAMITSQTVSSVFGRGGAVVAKDGDYTASNITNIAQSPITATNVQDAINQLAASSTTDIYKAGDVVNGNKVVMLSGSDVIHFNPSDETNYDKAIGISVNSAIAGDDVTIHRLGKLGGFGTLVVGDVYYADANGGVTNSLPLSGIVLEIGVAVASNEMDIKFNHEIISV